MSTPQPPVGGQPQDPAQGQPQYQPPAQQPQYQQPQYQQPAPQYQQPTPQYQQPVAGYQQPTHVPVEAKRPWNVSLLAVLALLLAALDIAIGLIVLLNRTDAQFVADSGTSKSNLTYFGIGFIIVGAITLMLSIGLFGGSRLARGVIALFCVLHIAAAIVVLIMSGSTNTRIAQSANALIAIIVLLMLYSGARTKAFFARG
ncbi:MAG: hypothetical protein ACOYD0_00250 [Candidatus Nanopelagicales bacterium]